MTLDVHALTTPGQDNKKTSSDQFYKFKTNCHTICYNNWLISSSPLVLSLLAKST